MATSSNKKHLLVAAIDFGTTFSGYAFSWVSKFKDNPTDIQTKHWTGHQNVSLKTETCILIGKDGETVMSFGYDAERQYAESPERDQLYLFKRFKMMLDVEKGLQMDIDVRDVQGKPLNAIKVFSLSIKCLMEDMEKQLSNQIGKSAIKPEDIRWVLTVPAIWNDGAKQFMREAALKAGIPDSQLEIALEPECAALFCRYIPHTDYVDNDSKGFATLAAKGEQYMILDAGGGTVDITIHEVVDKKTVKEVEKASGGAWGGITVDQAYYDWLEKISVPGILTALRKESYEDEMEIVQNFEVQKRTIKPDRENSVNIRLPMLCLNEIAERIYADSFAALVKKRNLLGEATVKRDILTIKAEAIKKLFQPAIDKIINHVTNLLNRTSVTNCSRIIMVGGFSESPMLQEAVRKAFPEHTIIIPAEAGLAVLKGAVIFGHNPAVISERICRYTYGVRMCGDYDPNKHPIEKRINSRRGFFSIFRAPRYKCADMFNPLVKDGETLKAGQPSEPIDASPLFESLTKVSVEVYATKKSGIEFVTDDGCDLVGRVTVPLPDTGTGKHIQIYLILGGTEMQVECKYVNNGQITKAYINFLG